MTPLSTTPITPAFGVEITGTHISEIVPSGRFGELRALFEAHSALLFRRQDLSDEAHLELAQAFGPIEDRLADERKPGEAFSIPKVSNVRKDGSITDEMDLHTLNLQSNFLWHTDSTFIPTPALSNIITARVVASEGGQTELASTRAAWAAMPETLRARIRGRGIWHHYANSRAKISPELAKLPMFHKWPATHWNAIWPNPVNGHEALYIASHAYAVDGYDKAESEALLDELMDFCTRPEFTYAHNWEVGDVLIWDQRAVLHRGRPWPFDQPRTLSSICCSVTKADGIDAMRLPV
ncbi:Alpha-ketoglutarate-dependent 2,4-dichlorophenoxyacetate dioxygenase [Shimia sp. SK013]|uniref:TauD/TfdA dioxygenase family protein n=1 Tax=Shimia sp. SK013 TaxID=1389006 RepID=UPI0006B49F20|nr:TauD/TfdA family dioxygenase [Shimia sp. SK013]KPA23723.1 Alpha-ketoglutarate-dependent 2,4-dichlorophenoxyacetate dioxygenase [Shimia sp. SK013]